ncbi:MAG: hypothetical protein R3Y54_13430 [Eubacteriales bacterium]
MKRNSMIRKVINTIGTIIIGIISLVIDYTSYDVLFSIIIIGGVIVGTIGGITYIYYLLDPSRERYMYIIKELEYLQIKRGAEKM